MHHHGGHQYLHNYHGKVKEEKRAVGDVVSATIDGQLVSWINVYAGPGVATNTPAPGAVDSTLASTSDGGTTEDADMPPQSSTLSPTATTSTLSTSSSSTSSTLTLSATSEGWARQAYFNAASGTTEGLTFLNHFGGTDGIPGTSAGGSASGNLDHVEKEWRLLTSAPALVPLFPTPPPTANPAPPHPKYSRML